MCNERKKKKIYIYPSEIFFLEVCRPLFPSQEHRGRPHWTSLVPTSLLSCSSQRLQHHLLPTHKQEEEIEINKEYSYIIYFKDSYSAIPLDCHAPPPPKKKKERRDEIAVNTDLHDYETHTKDTAENRRVLKIEITFCNLELAGM